MADLNIKLTKEQQQYLVFAVLLLGGGGFSYVKYFWLPISVSIAAIEISKEKVQGDINLAKGQAVKLEKLQAQLAELKLKDVAAAKRLPPERDMPFVIDTVSALTRQHNVDLLSFIAGNESAKDYFVEVPYTLATKGNFHDIGRLLAALALEERIFNVRDVGYTAPDPSGKLSVNITLISYKQKPKS